MYRLRLCHTSRNRVLPNHGQGGRSSAQRRSLQMVTSLGDVTLAIVTTASRRKSHYLRRLAVIARDILLIYQV